MLGRTESRAEKDRQKQIQDKCQALLTQMLRDEDNKYCVDCDAKGPRWASWNLGIFLCIRCAGIHRNLGVHISKVKSVNLDSWTPEQVVSLQQMGNSRARAVYEATLPDSWRRPQTDSSLENFIRAKYQHKRYIAKEWVPPPTPKVDWDKELDEEAERQRKRKKEKQASQASSALAAVRKPVPEAAVPALPKPSSSPKASRSSGEPATSAAVDLLGLNSPPSTTAPAMSNTSDDVFTSFLSSPPTNIVASVAAPGPAGDIKDAKGRSAEEDSFFNQPTVQEDKKQLTKDSIMALYSQSSNTPAFNAGMFPQVAPVNPNPMAFANGLSQLNQGFGLAQQQNLNSNPFFNMSAGNQFAMQQPSPRPPVPSLEGDLIGLDLTQLPQQMSALNMNPMGQAVPSMPLQGFNTAPPPQSGAMFGPNTTGQTFTMHLWQ